MAHFAQIENGKVVDIIVIDNADCGGGEFPKSEPIGQKYIKKMGLPGEWLQTSYHSNFRQNFAGSGFIYDSSNDRFIIEGTENE